MKPFRQSILNSFLLNTQLAAVLTTVAILGVPAWFLFDRQPPVTRLEGEANPDIVLPGTMITITWTVVGVRDCSGTVRRVIIDHGGIPWDFNVVPAVAKRSDEKYHLVRGDILVPRGIACGKAEYFANLEFVCNPIQWLWPIKEKSKPVPFTVDCSGSK